MKSTQKISHNSLASQSGQILVGFLLVMVLGITLTLSLISQTTLDTRTTTTTEQSSRAYNAAEAGVEEALKKVESGEIIPSDIPVSTSETPLGDVTYKYSVANVGSSNKAFVFPKPLLSDDTAQVWLAHPDTLAPVYTSSRIKVLWGNLASPINATTPALEIVLTYKDPSGTFKDQRWYYRPSGTTIPTGFNPASEVSTATQTILGENNNLNTNQQFAFSVNEGGSSGLNLGKIGSLSTNTPILLRFRLLYNNDASHILGVAPIDSSASSFLPPQGYQVESTGSSNIGATRKIIVFRSFPFPSSIFDFGLFSGSTQKALKK